MISHDDVFSIIFATSCDIFAERRIIEIIGYVVKKYTYHSIIFILEYFEKEKKRNDGACLREICNLLRR